MQFDDLAVFLAEDAIKRNFPLPPMHAIVQIFELSFYASLAREEGVSVRCDILLIDPRNPDPIRPSNVAESRWRCVPLGDTVPLTVRNLTKLAAAADPWATALAVHHDGSDWLVWALVDQQTHYNRWRHLDAESGPHNPQTYRISIEDTAYLAVYWDYDALLRSIRGEVLLAPAPVFYVGPIRERFDEVVAPFLRNVADLVGSDVYAKHDFWPAQIRHDVRSAIQRILMHIVRYRHGGALLISSDVDADLRPKYSVAYDRLGTALLKNMEATVMWREAWDASWNVVVRDAYDSQRHFERMRNDTSREISGCIHSIASLARVDGLLWLTKGLDVRGFGVEIRTSQEPEVFFACGDPQATAEMLAPRDPAIFGMRHRSMIRYCYAHAGSIGFVVSQDGPVRAMVRDGERLLLWEDIRLRDE